MLTTISIDKISWLGEDIQGQFYCNATKLNF